MSSKLKKFILCFAVIISVFCITVSAASDTEDYSIPSTALLTTSSDCAVQAVRNNQISHSWYNVTVHESTTSEKYYPNGCMVNASISGISGYLNDYYRMIVVSGIDIGSLEVPAGCSYKIQIPFIYFDFSAYPLNNVTWHLNSQAGLPSVAYDLDYTGQGIHTKMITLSGSNSSNQPLKLHKLYVSLCYWNFSQNSLTADFGFYDSIKVEITKAYSPADTSEIDNYEASEDEALDGASAGLEEASDLFSSFSFDFEFLSGLTALGTIFTMIVSENWIMTILKISLSFGLIAFLLNIGITVIKNKSDKGD